MRYIMTFSTAMAYCSFMNEHFVIFSHQIELSLFNIEFDEG